MEKEGYIYILVSSSVDCYTLFLYTFSLKKFPMQKVYGKIGKHRERFYVFSTNYHIYNNYTLITNPCSEWKPFGAWNFIRTRRDSPRGCP